MNDVVDAAAPAMQQARFIDVHYHAGPDAYIRRHSVLETGRRYQASGGWVVLKNHLGCSAAQAWEARSAGLPVSGSIVLNEIAGGLSWRAVERALCQHGDGGGRLLVHLPTVTGRAHKSRLARNLSHPILQQQPIAPLQVSQEDGRLRPETCDILRMARDYPVVISTGHANRDEVLRLIDAADQYQVPRLMLNQPANPLTGLAAAELKELAQAEMVYVEQTALTYLLGYQSRDDFEQVLRDVPRVVYSSDLGQTSQPDIAQWLQQSEAWFAACGLSTARLDDITRRTPLTMLSL